VEGLRNPERAIGIAAISSSCGELLTHSLLTMNQDLDTFLRSRTEHAYARWRACDAQRARRLPSDEECTQLKSELDLAAQALFWARRPSLTTDVDALPDLEAAGQAL
jgi:hypothetical protein